MTSNITRLIDIMAQLRNPDGGCPWDLEQTFASIVPYTIEEAYEVADAIAQNDLGELKEELGDLLLQVVFHARMAEEQGEFGFDDVAGTIADKMVRRHPHVFADDGADTPEKVKTSWEETKAQERRAKGKSDGALDGVALALPALTRAEKLTKRAARVGFDWTEADDIFAKIEEEIGELRHEIRTGAPAHRLEDELGDLLFCMANLARHLKIDPEGALRHANEKFTGRFHAMEKAMRQEGVEITEQSLDELENRWQAAKRSTTPPASP